MNMKSILEKVKEGINKLPFSRYAAKVPQLVKVAPFANYAFCGVVLAVAGLGIAVPKIRYNNCMAKMEKNWKDSITSYENLDLEKEFKPVFEQFTKEINGCTNDNAGLEKLSEIKKKFLPELDKAYEKIKTSTNEIYTAVCSEYAPLVQLVASPKVTRTKKQWDKFFEKSIMLSEKSDEAKEQSEKNNRENYAKFNTEFENLYSEKVDKINAAIKEAERQAYIAYVQKTIVGVWIGEYHKEILKFHTDKTFSFYFHKDAGKTVFGPERLYVENGAVKVKTGEKLCEYSGTYTFEGDLVVLNVSKAKCLNVKEVKAGDCIKSKPILSENGDRLFFNEISFKRN